MTASLVFRTCLWRARWSLPLALLVAVPVALWWPEVPAAGPDAAWTVTRWLHLPAFAVTAVLLSAAAEAWPVFARGRTGADVLRRLQTGPLQGCGAAVLGTLGALAPALLLTGAVFAAFTGLSQGLPADLHRHHALIEDVLFLDPSRDRVRVAGPDAVALAAVLLRPRAILPPGASIAYPRVQVFADDVPLHDGWLELGAGIEPVRLELPAGSLGELRIQRRDGPGLPLRFGPESIRAVGAEAHSWALGCVVGALLYAFPAALALALACLARGRLALPVLVVGMLAVLLAATLVGPAPHASAIAALASGRWFPAGEAVRQVAAFVSAAGVVTLLAMITGRRGARRRRAGRTVQP